MCYNLHWWVVGPFISAKRSLTQQIDPLQQTQPLDLIIYDEISMFGNTVLKLTHLCAFKSKKVITIWWS